MIPGSMDGIIVLAVACLYGVVSGFNDGGNLLASFTSGRVISPRLAALLLLLVVAGPAFLGTAVAHTIGASVIDLRAQGEVGFALLTLTSVAVVLLSWRLGIPTSMTLALVGAMLGWALGGGDAGAIVWSGVARVGLGMPVSVLAGLALALLLYRLVRRFFGGLPNATLLALARLQFATAALQAFAYCANDMEKTVGLIGVARALPAAGQPITFADGSPIVLASALFLAGAVIGGWGIARQVGFGVLRVRPTQALAQQLASGGVVAALAVAGAPVSTTQTIDAGLVGVGAAHRASAVRWGVVREILASWLLTLPLALALAAGLHLAVRLLAVSR